MSRSDLDIICPYVKRDKDRFLILWKSLQKFLKIPNYRIFLVSEDGDSPVDSPRIIGLKEKHLDPELNNKQFKNLGWWKQQIIKLLSYKVCDTEPILSIDCDCFLNKNLYIEDLVKNKKPKINISDYGGSWQNWYAGSKIISQLPYAIDNNKRIGVTPILLSNTILQSLNNYLDIIYDNKTEFLLSHIHGKIFQSPSDTWTEYSLYHIYADYTGMLHRYHYQDPDFHLSGNSFWSEKDVDSWDPSLSFKNPKHIFTVGQSTAKKSAEWVNEKIKDYIQ